MKFVWDEPKRLVNLARHEMDLADAYEFEWENAHIKPTYPSSTGRKRFLATGLLHGDLVTVIISPLGTEGYSVISMRNASRQERRDYEQQ